MTAKEMILKMPEVFNSEAAKDTNAVIQFDISEPLYGVINGDGMQVFEGQATNPTVTIAASDDNLVKLFKGQLNVMMAFMIGQLKIKGDMMLAQRLKSFIDSEKVAALNNQQKPS